MEEFMTPEAFDAALQRIWDEFLYLHNRLSEEANKELQELIVHHKEDMDDAAYLRVMYMKGITYEQQENKNAARYCAMRMHAIVECQRNYRKKKPRLLNLQGYAPGEDMEAFITRYTDFLEDTYRSINHRLMLIVSILFLAVFLVLTFALHISFIIAGLEALMLGMLTYLLQKRRMPDIFQKNQLNAIEKYVEAELLEFDRPIRYS